MNSILTSIKKVINIDESNEYYDVNIIMIINTALMSLDLLGVGTESGYKITDKSNNWDELLVTSKQLEGVKSYIAIKTQLIFDPPQTSFVIASMERNLLELEWKINVQAEGGDDLG